MGDSKKAKKFISRATKISENRIFMTDQIHGSSIKTIVETEPDNFFIGFDGILIDASFNDFILCVKIADCIPIFILNDNRLIGSIHSGWRGLKNNIVMNFLKNTDIIGYKRKSLHFYIGPYICGYCYEVGVDVAKKLGYATEFNIYIDLVKILVSQLNKEGIEDNMISKIKEKNFCTKENKEYYSHRSGDSQRMIAFAIQY